MAFPPINNTNDRIDGVFERLAGSEFRSSFKLKDKELWYLSEKGMDTIMLHAVDFINIRIAPAFPVNDGKQTPFGKHPVFVAQHATATCCRNCIEKWHGMKKGKELNSKQKSYILSVIKRWLEVYTRYS